MNANELLLDAAERLGVTPGTLRLFDEVEPFTGHRLVGAICLQQDHRYGAMVIGQVDDYAAPQLVWGTPKMHYPFERRPDGGWLFRFPPVTAVEIYEKIDGTNVLAYPYFNGERTVVGYKTRLVPVLKASIWGDWVERWQSILVRYPALPEAVVASGNALSFELFGSLNSHLIAYEVGLDVRLLFGLDPAGRVMPPSALDLDLPAATLLGRAESGAELEALYFDWRGRFTAANVDSERLSVEGAIWYCQLPDGGYVQFKCKAEQVEEIHWQADPTISRVVVEAAIFKVIEAGEPLEAGTVATVLAEDFEPARVAAAAGLVDLVLERTVRQLQFREQVVGLYRGLGTRFADDRATVMRALAATIPRSQMRMAFAILAALDEQPVYSEER